MWIILSFLTAIFEASKDGLCKHSLFKYDFNPYFIAWVWKALSVPFLIPFLFLYPPTEKLSINFWLALFMGVLLNVLGSILYIKAIKASDLSITLPLLAFTPVFLLFTSPLLISEHAGALGSIGIILIFIGTYILNVREMTSGYLAPFKALFKHKGPRLMLGVAILWSIAANMDKIGVLESSPLFWSALIQLLISLCLTVFILVKSPKSFIVSKGSIPVLLLIGLCVALGLICQMTALTEGIVPYVIAIKRTSIIIGVIFGGMFFRENDIKARLAGSAVMVAGIFFVTMG